MKFIIYNYRVKKVINKIWKSNFLNDNIFFKKILNQQINNKINQYKNKPFCVRVENTNICNAKCVMCPRDLMTRKQGVMSMDISHTIIDQCVDIGVDYINLHNYGEPLIDPNFVDKVKYAKNKGIKRVSTNTNASLLTKEISRNLILSGLDELFVSIDAIKKETYEKVRMNLDYDVLMSNLLNFLEIKKELNGKTGLVVNFVQSDINENEVREFIEFWKGKADNASISYAHDWVGSKKDSTNVKKGRLDYPCRLLFSDLTIAWNGDYILCCADYNSQVVLGNIENISIPDLWRNNKILNKYRELHLNGQSHTLDICHECTLNTVWWF